MKRVLLVTVLVLAGCSRLPPNTVDIIACSAAGGTWNAESASCKMPEPAPTPEPTPTPTPEPTPVPVPVPTPTPTPVPPSGCQYPVAEGQLVGLANVFTSSRAQEVIAGKRALGDLRNPARNPVALARENNRKLAAWLRSIGLCAFAGQEAIFVLALDGASWEEYHAAAETDGGWTQTPFKGNHRLEGATSNAVPDAPPIEEPGPVAGCGAPLPPPMSHFVVHRREVRDGWEVFDSTPVTAEGNRAYCDSVGFQGRNSCPARAEEPAWTKGDRVACERVMLSGDAPTWKWTGEERDGGLREGSNGFTFEHRKGSSGSLAVCDAVGERCSTVIG